MGTSCERNSSYSFVLFVLKLCICFLHGMRMCMWFVYNCKIIFSHFFHIVNLVIFHPLYINSWYLLWVQLLIVLYRLLWNFACLFFMVWGCASGLDVIVRLLLFFFYFFPHCELSHFSPSVYRQWVPREHNSSYNFILIFLELCTCFLHSLEMCMCFSYNPCHMFCHFFVLFELCHFLTSDV